MQKGSIQEESIWLLLPIRVMMTKKPLLPAINLKQHSNIRDLAIALLGYFLDTADRLTDIVK